MNNRNVNNSELKKNSGDIRRKGISKRHFGLMGNQMSSLCNMQSYDNEMMGVHLFQVKWPFSLFIPLILSPMNLLMYYILFLLLFRVLERVVET